MSVVGSSNHWSRVPVGRSIVLIDICRRPAVVSVSSIRLSIDRILVSRDENVIDEIIDRSTHLKISLIIGLSKIIL